MVFTINEQVLMSYFISIDAVLVVFISGGAGSVGWISLEYHRCKHSYQSLQH